MLFPDCNMETREYKCSFGNVIVTIDGNNCNGSYQTNGQFIGIIDGDIVKAKWTNDGKEGLIELDLSNNKLEGKWKKGLVEGPMRGRWEGVLIDDLNTDDSNPFDNGLEDDGATSKTVTLEISFNQEYEHLLPYEITLYAKAISRSDLKNMNQTAFDEYLEEFEENRSSFAFADCDDFTDVLSNDLKANEINTLITNGSVTNNLNNVVKNIDDSGECQLVFFYVYEECDWEEMIYDVETEELSKIWYKINWEILGQLKYIDSIDIMSDEDGDVLNTIYPCTDGASPGNKYDGKTFVMVTDGQDNILINATEVDGLDLSEFNDL